MTIYAEVDRPSVRVLRQTILDDLVVQGSPLYGRVVFRSHGVVIADNTIYGTLALRDVRGTTVVRNWFCPSPR